MIQLVILSALAALALSGWFTGRSKARMFTRDKVSAWSRPQYHGAHLALWILVPGILAWLVWSAIAPGLVDAALMTMPIAQQLPVTDFERASGGQGDGCQVVPSDAVSCCTAMRSAWQTSSSSWPESATSSGDGRSSSFSSGPTSS